MIKDGEVWVLYKHLFDSQVSKTNLNVQHLRSELLFGSPIRTTIGDSQDRYEDVNDRSQEQEDIVSEFQVNIRREFTLDKSNPTLESSVYSKLLYDLDYREALEDSVWRW